MDIRTELTSYGKIVALETFSSLSAAQNFVAWWLHQPELPAVGAVHMRADVPDTWRERNPLPVELIDWRAIGSAQ